MCTHRRQTGSPEQVNSTALSSRTSPTDCSTTCHTTVLHQSHHSPRRKCRLVVVTTQRQRLATARQFVWGTVAASVTAKPRHCNCHTRRGSSPLHSTRLTSRTNCTCCNTALTGTWHHLPRSHSPEMRQAAAPKEAAASQTTACVRFFFGAKFNPRGHLSVCARARVTKASGYAAGKALDTPKLVDALLLRPVTLQRRDCGEPYSYLETSRCHTVVPSQMP